MRWATTLEAAHHLATVRIDLIVFEDGRITEEGTHKPAGERWPLCTAMPITIFR